MTGADAKTWFITGCSSGFGRELAEAVLARGDRATLTARDPSSLNDLVAQYPDRALAVALDVTRPQQADEAVKQTIAAFGGIDVLVNNAGYGVIGVLEEVSPRQYRPVFETNVFGLIEVTRAALPAMRRKGGRRIVNISSVGGIIGRAGFGYYNASKFAVEGFSEALAQEVAPFGMAVIIVEPGPFRTKFLSSAALGETEVGDYKAVSGAVRDYAKVQSGKQTGDPKRGVAVILRAVDSPNPPLRLPLGKDAYPRIRGKLAQIAQDLDKWESWGTDTDFLA